MMPSDRVFTVMAVFLAGALVIEIRALIIAVRTHYLLGKAMHLRVAALMDDCASEGEQQSKTKNTEDQNTHGANPLLP